MHLSAVPLEARESSRSPAAEIIGLTWTSLTWVLGAKLMSSEREVHALNHSVISPFSFLVDESFRQNMVSECS